MTGKVVQVLGPVVDVDFTDYLPAINEALERPEISFRGSSTIR